MPGSTDMGDREQFLREYQEQVLDSLVLPPEWRDRYRGQSCLKDGERQVYLLRDHDGEPAVLKTQPAGREASLRQEYNLLHKLRHPQLPQPLEYLEWEGREYLIREYIEGISLAEWVDAQGPLTPSQTRETALSLCQALDYLHSQDPPIICRDVKPQNVILDPSGCCHLIDLGAARRYRAEQQGDTVFLGTQVTAPPEQFGYQQTDQRSDVYSLGMLMRFLLSGSYEPLPGRGGQWDLARIIRRCTAFDPQDRYPTVRAVSRALEGRWRRWAIGAAVCGMCAVLLYFLLGPSAHEVRVSSSLLEEALRQELGLEAGEPIPVEQLGEVEQLLVCGQVPMGTLQEHEETVSSAHDLYVVETPHGDIDDEDLELLAQCSNLRVLILDYQQISDLTPLAGLPLEYLSLTGNQISDLGPLAGLTELQVLDLGENPVRTTEVLAELPALREVVLEATGITSVEVFRDSGIQSLNIRTTWVTDYTPLEECPHLTRLVTGSMPEGAAETLVGLTGLEELRLYSTPQLDLSLFRDFQRLQEVDFFGSTVSHPEVLTELSSLQYVNLGKTGVEDLSFAPSMPALTELDLRENLLTDLTPLLECPWLTRLVLSPRHQQLAQEQLDQAPFEIVYQA